jgi:hypothetical protein
MVAEEAAGAAVGLVDAGGAEEAVPLLIEVCVFSAKRRVASIVRIRRTAPGVRDARRSCNQIGIGFYRREQRERSHIYRPMIADFYRRKRR